MKKQGCRIAVVLFDVVNVIKQSVGMHSRSVLVSAIFEKGDEQGGEDCLSSSRFSNLWLPGTFAGIS